MIMGTPTVTLIGQSEASSVQINIDVILDGKQLHRITKTTFLGVIIDEDPIMEKK